MSFEAALRSRLSGLRPAGAHWGRRPQDSGMPIVVMQTVADPRPQHMRGPQRFRSTRVQIDAMAFSAMEKIALREDIITAIMPEGEFGGIHFRRGFVSEVRDLSEDTDTAFVHRDVIDATFWHD